MKFLSDKKNLYFTGTYLSLFVFMICSAANWGIGTALFKVLAILLFGLFLFRGNSADEKNTVKAADFEKSVMVLVVLLFNIFMLQRGKMQGEYEVLNYICSSLLIVIGITYFVFYHEGVSVWKWFSENKLILLVIFCFVLLSIEVVNARPSWDAWQYYTSFLGVIKKFNTDWAGIYGLRMCGHFCEGYSLWLILFQLFKEGTVSVQIADIILAGISIYAYYQILRKILGIKYLDKILVLATIPYAISPFVLGLVGNFSLDSAIMYFAVIFIACSLYHYECLELVFAFFFCFTKEPAVIFYVVYIIVKVICEYLSENSFHLWKLIKFGFANVKNYMYALPAILWMTLYKLNQGAVWRGSSDTINDSNFNCFAFNADAITMKLKQIFFLNFNWLFWGMIFGGIIVICIKKVRIEKEICKIIIPIGSIGIALIVFECAYITYILPRYIIPVIPIIYLVASTVLGYINKRFFNTWNVFLSVILIVQCFNVIDPVMGCLFPSRQTGLDEHQVVYETGSVNRFDDHIAYNRQNIYWTETITNLLDKAGYDGHMLIVYPDYKTAAPRYEILGNDRCLWNTQRRELECYNPTAVFPEECVWVDACNVSRTESKWGSGDYNSILYIVPKWTSLDENFISDNGSFSKEIIRQGDIDYKGFYVQYVVMNMKYKAVLGDGNYIVSPKQDSSLGIGTDGQWIWLKDDGDEIGLTVEKTGYQFMFNDYQRAMDVRYNKVDENGTVWVYEANKTNAQTWKLEKVNDYYMICWGDYALTYDIENNNIKLTPKSGSDNQLWSFTQ